jgi:eukaryotic-like serine/threonine-protein kinase
LQAFSLGRAEHLSLNDDASIPHFKRAIELDPNFALAYATLAVVYGNRGESKHSSDTLQKAFALRERVSEQEKFYISAHYYENGVYDWDKAIEIYEQWKRIYPRNNTPLDNLSLLYNGIGNSDKAMNNASAALRIDAKDGFAYQNLASAYLALNRYDEARAVVDQAIANNADSESLHLISYELAFIRDDDVGMRKELAWAAGKADDEDLNGFL